MNFLQRIFPSFFRARAEDLTATQIIAANTARQRTIPSFRHEHWPDGEIKAQPIVPITPEVLDEITAQIRDLSLSADEPTLPIPTNLETPLKAYARPRDEQGRFVKREA